MLARDVGRELRNLEVANQDFVVGRSGRRSLYIASFLVFSWWWIQKASQRAGVR
jgi:hypothetical protein